MIAIIALFVAVFLMVSASGVVPGKVGNSYLKGATLSGGSLQAPASFDLDWPDRGDVRQLHSPANGIFMSESKLAALEAIDLPYQLTLHYDFGRYTGRVAPAGAAGFGGTTDWSGRFDGDSLIYFDRPLGGYGAGWFEATPPLAERLRLEIAWAMAAPGVPSPSFETFATQFRRGAIALSLTIFAIALLYLRGAKPANVSPLQMQERMALRDLQIGPGAWR
jgi:hypothetical protein